MTNPLEGLKRQHYTVVEIDPPWKFSAGTKSRPQHYPRMTFAQVCDIPVRDLLHPDGGRVLLWITAPLLGRVKDLGRSWGLRYCTTIPWIKLWPREDGLFIYPDSLARGTGYEVCGNAEYIVILKWRRPQSIKGNPFPGYFMTPRREHSRKPDQLAYEVEQRLAGPFCSVFSRQSRKGWDTSGNERNKFDEVAA